jgi:hypothetical protein
LTSYLAWSSRSGEYSRRSRAAPSGSGRRAR